MNADPERKHAKVRAPGPVAAIDERTDPRQGESPEGQHEEGVRYTPVGQKEGHGTKVARNPIEVGQRSCNEAQEHPAAQRQGTLIRRLRGRRPRKQSAGQGVG